MRRGMASLIMGVSLLIATASWSGFILSRTVLDPGRSERLAQTLLDNDDVRSAIVDRLADSVEAQIPAEVPVSRDIVEDGAEAALDDPRVEALIVDGLVRAHQNALAGNDEPVMIDAGALGAAGRQAVVDLQPELDAVLPAAPSVEVELPSTGLSWLGTLKRYVDRLTLFGAVVSLIGVTTAFVLARNRAAALRRIAFWAFGAAAFWLAVAFALPWLLGRIAPSSVSIASAAIDVFFGAMIRPAVALALIGVGVLLLSFVWPAIERRRPAAILDRRPVGRTAPVARPMVAAPASVANQPTHWAERAVPPHPPSSTGYDRPAPTHPSTVVARAGSWNDDPYGERPYQRHPGYTDRRAAPRPQVSSDGYDPYHEPSTRRYAPGSPDPDATIQFPEITSNGGSGSRPTFGAADQEAVTRRTTPEPDFGWGEEPATAPIDPEVAAEADDFGAEWVEGVGYVDEPRRG